MRIGAFYNYVDFPFPKSHNPPEINADDQLTEADKKQLKEFYLQNMIAPKTRKLLEKHFPEEFKNANTRSVTPQSTHQDR